MNRLEFIKSIQGIQYPHMLVSFFDHFIALKQIVEERGNVQVENCTNETITFSIVFQNKLDRDKALEALNSTIMVYGRPIKVGIDVLTGKKINIMLQ